MTAIEELERAVLALPVKERVLLAESLLESLSPTEGDWSESQEMVEVERREREIASGEVHAVSDAELWARIEASRKA